MLPKGKSQLMYVIWSDCSVPLQVTLMSIYTQTCPFMLTRPRSSVAKELSLVWVLLRATDVRAVTIQNYCSVFDNAFKEMRARLVLNTENVKLLSYCNLFLSRQKKNTFKWLILLLVYVVERAQYMWILNTAIISSHYASLVMFAVINLALHCQDIHLLLWKACQI